MSEEETLDLQNFCFRGLQPLVFMGTASDRYAGWLGQIYSQALNDTSSILHIVV